jgi:HSP20 family protein
MDKVKPSLSAGRVNRIRQFREERDFSQEQVAKKLGVSRQTIFALEKGLWDPSLTLATRICELFDTAFDEMFGIENRINKKGGEMTRHLMPLTPFQGLGDLHREIDRFFEDAFFNLNPPSISRIPALNIQEEDNKYMIEVAVPGFKEDEIEIEAGEDYLTLTGKRREEKEAGGKGKKFHRREFNFASFERTVAFPDRINDEKISAELKDGTLQITVPKKISTKPKARKIKVVRR